ncbi:MAG: carboxylating nicotinate-nucleotide diphosphorylase [Deltaproteobacteria bacterium]|nr:carboxylating nicotinate-nucleotide diphosphorylase [Deltaproteobacteria bacterium]
MLTAPLIRQAVAQALAEDAPWGDLTSELFTPPEAQARLSVRFKQAGVLCGLPVARETFLQVSPDCQWRERLTEGAQVQPGDIAAQVSGSARGLLGAERVALNFLQRLSGVATLTAAYVARAREGSPQVRIVDTRKTTPGLRALEKYAVTTGGAANHRYGLSDGILVKDNHLAVLAKQGVTLAQAVASARLRAPHLCRIEVEVENLDMAREALEAGVDVLLLDNMSIAAMREAVGLARGRALTEASGNITLARVAEVAATGVDFISAGALTHSAPALDISLDFEA